jgi:hypothetical protein
LSNWRRKAIALFPTLRRDLQRRDFSIYMVFFDLVPMVREAHESGNRELLRRIYGFAEWCFNQKAKDIWNAAGVAFYEHLFDKCPSVWEECVRWLSPRVIQGCWGLWEFRLPAKDLAKVQQLIADCRNPLYQEARLRSL